MIKLSIWKMIFIGLFLFISSSTVLAVNPRSIQFKSFTPSVSPLSSLAPGDLDATGAPLTIRDYSLSLDATAPFPSSIDLTGHEPLAVTMAVPSIWNVSSVQVTMNCLPLKRTTTSFSRTATLSKDAARPSNFKGHLLLLDELRGSYSCMLSFAFLSNNNIVHSVNVDTHLHDPYGTVTNASDGKPLKDVKVTLYFFDNAKSRWVFWMARQFRNQINPQTTDESGTFSFLTPEGDYYLLAEKIGFEKYQSPRLTVRELPIEHSFSLKPLHSQNTSYFVLIAIALIIVILIITLRVRSPQLKRKR